MKVRNGVKWVREQPRPPPLTFQPNIDITMQPRCLLLLICFVALSSAQSLRRVEVKWTTETLLPEQDVERNAVENYDSENYHVVRIGPKARLFPRRFAKIVTTTTTTTVSL
uniref:Secreted protein n=1 Tax=Steinernema glaseri TaxID=37863 RepID=A0A1I7ZCA0_9BILA